MHCSRRMFGCATGWMLLVLFFGCGGSNQVAVDGRVTLDGKPIDGGVISLIPVDHGSGLASGGKIENGTYSISSASGLKAGVYRVEIRWTRKTGRMRPAMPPAPPTPAVEETIEVVPERYNRNSELEVEIKPSTNQCDFELKSKSTL